MAPGYPRRPAPCTHPAPPDGYPAAMSEQPGEALKGEPTIDPRNEPDGIRPEAVENDDRDGEPDAHRPGRDGGPDSPRPVP